MKFNPRTMTRGTDGVARYKRSKKPVKGTMITTGRRTSSQTKARWSPTRARTTNRKSYRGYTR